MHQENSYLYNQTATSSQGYKSAETKFQAGSPKSSKLAAPTTFETVSNNATAKSSLFNKAMIELAIDSSDAFDYENPDKAKYSVNDLKFILHKEVVEI